MTEALYLAGSELEGLVTGSEPVDAVRDGQVHLQHRIRCLEGVVSHALSSTPSRATPSRSSTVCE